mgnify:CR=1 FL=1
MLEAKFVTTEQGTGIVHCAPSHGPDDFNLCLKHGIKAIETVDGDGKYTKNVHLFEGNHIFKANPIVIEKLKEQKKLLANGELVHSYPHSWRSKAPLVHRATPQWFISMESHKLRDKALKALDETTFYPSKGKERLKSMIETRPDWCVSRQRVWGVPLPIFISKKDEKVLVDDEVFNNIANIFEKEGATKKILTSLFQEGKRSSFWYSVVRITLGLSIGIANCRCHCVDIWTRGCSFG